MLPIRDNISAKAFPLVTLVLIAANAAVFWHELTLGRRLDGFIGAYALVPARPNWPDLVTSMFLHGGWTHVLGNVWTLWIFGDSVEHRLGKFRFLALYLMSGVAAGVFQVAAAPASAVPVIGASGAIAGVLGAYMWFFPGAKVTTVVPVFIFLHYAEVPAFLYLGVWFLTQVYSGTLSLGGVAWWAHVGGFLAGAFWAWRLGRAKAGRSRG